MARWQLGSIPEVVQAVRHGGVEFSPPSAFKDGELAWRIISHVRDVVILLSKDRRLLFANKAAERLLARSEWLRLNRGRLTAGSSANSLAVERAIDGVCSGTGDREEIAVLRGRASAPLVLTIRCIDAARGKLILIVTTDGHVEPARLSPLLRRCFGLTSSEAEVASALAAGRSSASIAASRGVRVNTVRTQIKSVAHKLGCATQSQISAIVRATPLIADAPD